MGRVAARAENLFIASELVGVADGAQLWGEQYNRKVTDVFAVQEEIAGMISEKLRLRLSGEEKTRLRKRFTVSPQAYQLYLKGRYFWNRRTEQGFRKAIEYFQQAVAVDPVSYDLIVHPPSAPETEAKTRPQPIAVT